MAMSLNNCFLLLEHTLLYCSNNMNCLTDAGHYVATWADDSTQFIGQEILPDEQCRLEHGTGYTFSVSYSNKNINSV